ncbi:YpsA SLOG family protein [Spectribacter hydrogenoxidans]|uniref:YpsA SLOG family protein n=1 Tax=Spectribacter hydrogenoxidans TaxID=3075608 RepID=UPI003C12B879
MPSVQPVKALRVRRRAHTLFRIPNKKPYLIVDAHEMTVERAAARIVEFIAAQRVNRLNAAGPREGKNPGAYQYTYDALRLVFAGLGHAGQTWSDRRRCYALLEW